MPTALKPLFLTARRRLLALVGALLTALIANAPLGVAHAQAPADPAVEAAIQRFRAGAEADGDAAARNASELQQLSARLPADPRVMAYAGAATARLARHTLWPWKKMRHAEDGLALLDKALALIRPAHEQAPPGAAAPALEARLVAASTFVALPGMFQRAARGEKLLAELLGQPALEQQPAGFRSAVHFLAAEQARLAQRTDEARRHYQRVIALQGPETEAARAALAGLPS